MLDEKKGRLIEFINESLDSLRIILKKYQDEKKDEEKKILLAALERKAEECVETAIKLNQQVLEAKGKIAESYYSSFIELKILKMFNDNFLKKIASTAGFRNRLAHEYMDLDEKITVDTIRKIVDLYPKYLLGMMKYLEKNS